MFYKKFYQNFYAAGRSVQRGRAALRSRRMPRSQSKSAVGRGYGNVNSGNALSSAGQVSTRLNLKRERDYDQMERNYDSAHPFVRAIAGPLRRYQRYAIMNEDEQGHSPFHNWVVAHRRQVNPAKRRAIRKRKEELYD